MAITLDGNNGIASPDFEPSSSTVPTNGLFLPATNALGFATNSTERLRLDASGNLGVGTTSPTYKLTVAGYSNVASSNKFAIGGTADYQALLYMESATETFTIENTSDYAASAIILKTNNSERARIDSSGNFGIGTSSPTSPFEVAKSASIDNAGAANKWVARLRDTTATAAGVGGGLLFQGIKAASGSVGNFAAIAGLKENATDNNENGYLAFFTTPNATGLLNERARIDASGNLLVGKTATDNSERLGVKSSGSTSSTYAVRVDNSAATAMFMVRDDGYLRSPTTYNLTSGTANVSIDANGFFTRATSSLRYKKDVVDYDKGLAIVNLLRPVYYKSSVAGADGTIPDTQFAGMIAEEIDVLGLSEFVEYGPDGEVESIRYGNMVSLAFKAIQELNQRLEALENK